MFYVVDCVFWADASGFFKFHFLLASYDVNKDGVRVAVLTFPKSAYRLGETVTGVVEINERTSRARVIKVNSPVLCCLK